MKLFLATGLLISVGLALAKEIKPQGPFDRFKGFFQYANVPKEHEYVFSFNQGNPSHYVSRYEEAKAGNFRTKVKWADSNDGMRGQHFWDYNHGHNNDKKTAADNKPEFKPLHKPEYKPQHEAEYRPKWPEFKPELEPQNFPQHKPEYKPEHEVDYRPKKPEYKPVLETEYKPKPNPEYKPEHQTVHKPEFKPENQPENRREFNPELKFEYKPEYNSDYEEENEEENDEEYDEEYEIEPKSDDYETDYELEDEQEHNPAHKPEHEPENRREFNPDLKPEYNPTRPIQHYELDSNRRMDHRPTLDIIPVHKSTFYTPIGYQLVQRRPESGRV